MKEFFKKYREILLIISWIAFLFTAVRLIVLPIMAKIAAANNEIQEENLKKDISNKNVGELPKIKQQYENLKQNSQSVDVLLEKANAVQLIKKLEKSADQSGVKTTITVQDQVTAKPQAKNKNQNENTLINDLPSKDYLQLKISADGNYNQIISFIKTLENLEYYNDIIALDVKKESLSGSKEKQSIDGTVISPFSSEMENNSKDIQESGNSLNASIDVVFYTK